MNVILAPSMELAMEQRIIRVKKDITVLTLRSVFLVLSEQPVMSKQTASLVMKAIIKQIMPNALVVRQAVRHAVIFLTM